MTTIAIAANEIRGYKQNVKSLPYSRSCFVCGAENPHGLKMRFFADPTTRAGVRGKFQLAQHHVGFRTIAHGGILATVLDEAMAWAGAVATRRFGLCAEINVRFLRPVNVGQQLTVTAELVADRKRLWELAGEIRDDKGEAYAKATAKFVPLSDTQQKDFVSDLRWDETTVGPGNFIDVT